jgi:hypothetical protein
MIFSKVKSVLLLAGLLFILQSQNDLRGQDFANVSVNENQARPFLYLGPGLSANEYGFGLTTEVPISNRYSVNANLGLGGWGFKVGGSFNFYPVDVSKKSEFSLGFSWASGLKDFETDLWIYPYGDLKTVNLDLNPVSTINATYTYNLKVGKTCKLGFTAGYALSLNSEPAWVLNSTDPLNRDSKSLLDILQPGGMILGVKFVIGAR